MQLLAVLGLAGVALAVPQIDPNASLCYSVSRRPNGCTARGQPSAKAFCSSFLGIPVQTTTATVRGTVTSTATSTAAAGTVTVTGAPLTNTVTSTSTITVTLSTPTTTVVSTTSSTSTVTITGGVATACAQIPAAAEKKLMKRAVPKPTCLRRFGNGAELTSACSCFPISTQTSTVTSTGAATTVTSTTTIGGTATVTSTPIVTSTIVSTSTITSSAGAIVTVTSTSTAVTTTTVRTNAVATVLPTSFAIVASGGGIDGTFADAGDNNEDITTFGPASSANAFYINAGNNYLIEANGTGVGLIANEGPAGGAPAVFWDDSNTINEFPDDLIPITCNIAQNADDTCSLSCEGPFGSNNNYCDGVWYLSDDDQSPCVNNFDTYAFAATP